MMREGDGNFRLLNSVGNDWVMVDSALELNVIVSLMVALKLVKGVEGGCGRCKGGVPQVGCLLRSITTFLALAIWW